MPICYLGLAFLSPILKMHRAAPAFDSSQSFNVQKNVFDVSDHILRMLRV